MNLAINTTMNLEKIQEDATEAQAVVLTLVDREADILAKLEEVEALAGDERYEAIADLVLEADGLVEIHKALKEQINRVQKRVEKISNAVREDTIKELSRRKEAAADTEKYVVSVKLNPPSVVVDDEKKIPKEFRREPPPIPSWKKWPADKNAIKKALLNKEKRSINGVHLERSKKLDIKRK